MHVCWPLSSQWYRSLSVKESGIVKRGIWSSQHGNYAKSIIKQTEEKRKANPHPPPKKKLNKITQHCCMFSTMSCWLRTNTQREFRNLDFEPGTRHPAERGNSIVFGNNFPIKSFISCQLKLPPRMTHAHKSYFPKNLTFTDFATAMRQSNLMRLCTVQSGTAWTLNQLHALVLLDNRK